METIYYATPEDIYAHTSGSANVQWFEVTIIGTQYADSGSKKIVLVETLDKAKRFTSFEEHMFIKTNASNKKEQ